MIIKKRKKPLILKKYEALLPRLPSNSPHYRQAMYDTEKYRKGYEGELEVDYHLELLPQADYTILQDVSLKTRRHSFQMDNVLLSQHAIYLIEVKNFQSNVTYHTDADTFILDNGKQEYGTSNPIVQVKIQKEKLTLWLQERNLPDIPIHCYVAISDPTTILQIKGEPTENSKLIFHGEQIPWKIRALEDKYNAVNTYQHQKIGHQIVKGSTEFDKNILSKYPIHPNELLSGIRCVKCNILGMVKYGWAWRCARCQGIDKYAAQRAINEYLLLIKPWLTNKEAQTFLGQPSRHAVLRILRKTPGIEYNQLRKRWEKK